MKIYVKYITKNLFLTIIITISILSSIIWLTQSIRYLNLITNSGISFLSFLKLSLFLIPAYIQTLFPVAVFIAVTFYYYKLDAERELVILKASGLSNLQIYKPVIVITIIITIFHYLFSFYVTPYCDRFIKNQVVNFKNNYIHLFLEEGVFNNKIKNITIYVEKKLSNNAFSNIFIYDQRDPKKKITITSEYSNVTVDNNFLKFKFLNGSKQEVEENQKESILYFNSFTYNLDLQKKNVKENLFEPNELYINELYDLYRKTSAHKFMFEIHSRLTWPLYNIILGFLATNIFLFSYVRKGLFPQSAFISTIAMIITITYFLVKNLIISNEFFILFIYLKIIMLILSQIYILSYK